MTLVFLLLIFGQVRTGNSASPAARLASEAEEARKGKKPEAAALYERALKAAPDWKEGWWAVGGIYYEQNRYGECTDAFARLSKLEPKGGPAWTMLGLCEFETKQFESASLHLRQGQDLGAGTESLDKVAKFQLAKLYTRAGSFEEALGLLATLAQITSENRPYLLATGLAALWKPILPEDLPAEQRELVYLAGKAFWDAGARKAADAQKDFAALIEKYPDAPGVHFLYGSFELNNNADHALVEFERELSVSPGHIGALSAIAAEYLRRGDFEKGLPYAHKCIEILPNALASHVILGRLLVQSGDLKGGSAELETAKQIAPDDPQPRIALASVYAKLGREEDASRERREFLRLTQQAKK